LGFVVPLFDARHSYEIVDDYTDNRKDYVPIFKGSGESPTKNDVKSEVVERIALEKEKDSNGAGMMEVI